MKRLEQSGRTVAVALIVCAIASIPAVPAFGQAFLKAEPVGPFEGLADCSDLLLYQEPLDPSNFGTARTSDEEGGFIVFEDWLFGEEERTVTNTRVWGIDVDFTGGAHACAAQDDANFNVRFWGQSGGAPDSFNVIVEALDVPSIQTDTGIGFAFTTIIQQDIDLGSLDASGTVWVAHERVNDGDSCFWLWVDETVFGTYDDQAYQGGLVSSDQPFCLAGSHGDSDGGGDGGSDDGGVPATTGIGVILLVLALGGCSAYFVRRT